MAIGLHNYEAYLLDYQEGNLEPAQEAELRAFLAVHPELSADIDSPAGPVLTPDDDAMEHSALRKDQPQSGETGALRYLEGLLTRREKWEFEKKLARDPALGKLLETFGKTRFVAEDVAFGDRDQLYRDLPGDAETRVLRYTEGLMSDAEMRNFEKDLRADPRLRALHSVLSACRLEPNLEEKFPEKQVLKRDTRVLRLFMTPLRVAAGLFLVALFAVLIRNNMPVEPRNKVAEVPANPPLNTALLAEVVAPANGAGKEVQPAAAKTPPAAVAENKIQPGGRAVKQETANRSSRPSKPPVRLASQTPEKVPATEPVPDHVKPEPVFESTKRDDAPVTVVYGLENLAVANDVPEEEPRTGLLEKVARMARKFRKLGVRNVDASLEPESVTLTIHHVSVEKKYGRL